MAALKSNGTTRDVDQDTCAVTCEVVSERRQSEQLAQAASQYARSLLEASLDPMVTISSEGKITDVNSATERVTGVLRESLIGSDFAEYFTDPQKAREGYQQVFSDGSVTNYPLAIRNVSGKITDVIYNANLYRDVDGNVLGVFAAARDVTESKLLAQVLSKRNIELEKATAVALEASLAKSNFLSSMSHELRTPLNAILGFAQLIESNVSPPTPSQKRSLDQILSAGWYLLELINETLDLAQIESGKAVIFLEPVPLDQIMRECQELVEPLAVERGIGINFPQVESLHWVHADRTRTRQILINLLHNAIKYNKPQGMVTMVCTLAAPASVRISIRDTGPGLSPQQLGQLFQPFNRLGRESGAEQGTGIGLVVVKRLVELMGGVIGVESQLGAGSNFWIELNLTHAPLPTISAAEQAGQDSPKPTACTERRTVLYVEDNPANLALVQELLTRRSHLRLISAADGNLGVEYAQTYLPDVILMDLNLPGMSGVEAMKTLRCNSKTAHIPIIALSANAFPADIARSLDAGFFNYITKPIKLSEFMDALDVALEFANRKPMLEPAA
jgi:PAS domain S-box-containing protein